MGITTKYFKPAKAASPEAIATHKGFALTVVKYSKPNVRLYNITKDTKTI